jgi:hypothetical protein
MYEKPNIRADEIQPKLEKLGMQLSDVAVWNIMNEHRHSLRFLIDQGATHLKRLL